LSGNISPKQRLIAPVLHHEMPGYSKEEPVCMYQRSAAELRFLVPIQEQKSTGINNTCFAKTMTSFDGYFANLQYISVSITVLHV